MKASTKASISITIITTIVTVLASLIVGFIAAFRQFDFQIGILLVLGTAILVQVISIFICVIYKLLVPTTIITPEILTEETDALSKALKMQRDANRSVLAMWTLMSYSVELQGYFKKTMSRDVYTQRIIDLKNIPLCDILSHMEEYWSQMKENYVIYFSYNVDYEVLIVDHKEAGIFLFPGRSFGCFFLKHSERHFVTTMEGMFNRLKESSILFPIKEFEVKFDESKVKEWLQSQLEKFKSN